MVAEEEERDGTLCLSREKMAVEAATMLTSAGVVNIRGGDDGETVAV